MAVPHRRRGYRTQSQSPYKHPSERASVYGHKSSETGSITVLRSRRLHPCGGIPLFPGHYHLARYLGSGLQKNGNSGRPGLQLNHLLLYSKPRLSSDRLLSNTIYFQRIGRWTTFTAQDKIY